MVLIFFKFWGDKFWVCFGGLIVGEKGLLFKGLEYFDVVDEFEFGEFFKLLLLL